LPNNITTKKNIITSENVMIVFDSFFVYIADQQINYMPWYFSWSAQYVREGLQSKNIQGL
jgi:hypothetical protein